jgi:pimeloyl-ACP methyl ester carboxylesterase
MPKVKLDGLTLHYQQAGRGQNVVMLHGLCSNLAFWYFSLLPILSRDFRMTVYDMRGHGLSDMPAKGYTTLDLASELAALLQYLNIERAHLVGHSFGGAVALQFASLFPARVASLTLADARVPALQPTLPPRGARSWKRVHARLRGAGLEVPDDLPRVAYGFFEELARLQRDARGRAPAWRATPILRQWNRDSHLARRWLQLVRTTSAPAEMASLAGLTVDRIRQVVQPTLAIFGERSNCLQTLWGLERLLPHCRKVIVPGAGHFHPILQQERFVQALKQFIRQLGDKQPDDRSLGSFH